MANSLGLGNLEAKVKEKANFVWSIADILRGDYKQSDYGKVILPFTVLRRLDCVLEPTIEEVDQQQAKLEDMGLENPEPMLNETVNQILEEDYSFHNHSGFTFEKLKADQNHIADNLKCYINGFSSNVRKIIDYFNFEREIDRLDDANLLFKVMQKFAAIDLHPDVMTNLEMGYVFEELIRKFSEQSNETAGEHFTPREVIRLMVKLLFNEDSQDLLNEEGKLKTLYDPACGTGGMLSVAEEYVEEVNPEAHLELFGQELNPESYAICKSDMLLKGHNTANIKFGNSFTEDGLRGEKFDYMLSNPPFGVNWKKVRDEIEDEHDQLGFDGRFGAGTPRVSDGSLLFLQHMISKMKEDEGSRLGIIFNGSPLFTGGAGSGESEIRRWIIENDWLETIVALPEELFYNTGIATYIWILTSDKTEERKGKVQLINAVDFYEDMRKSLGNKRSKISAQQIEEVAQIHQDFSEGEYCKIFDNQDFGYQRVAVEQPIRRSYQVTEETIEDFKETDGFQRIGERKNGEEYQAQIIAGLEEKFEFGKVYSSHNEFMDVMEDIFSDISIRMYVYIKKALFAAFGEEDETAEPARDKKGNKKPNSDLREYENIPLKEDINNYFDEEIKPHLPDAWINHDKTKIGYEIPFTRYFYEYEELRDLEEIDNDIKELEDEILGLLSEVTIGE
ncbi:class I SAM-dependent DNA methyltransferase [Halanaerocella petrolearia]